MLARRPANRFHRGRFGGAPGFTGNFAQFFTSLGLTALQVVQSDLGVTYGGTLLDTGGAGPVLTLTGTLNAGLPVVPIQVKCTLGGALGVWTYGVSYDGGSTFPQTGTSAASVVLTGAGAGLTVGIAAGVAVLNNTWNATLAALADQTGNGWHYTMATVSGQPVITVGVNGKAGALGDGVDDRMNSALNTPATGTTRLFAWGVIRPVTWTSADFVFGCGGAGTNGSIAQITATPRMRCQSGTSGPENTGAVLGSYCRLEADFNNNAADYLKLGVPKVSGTTGAGAAQVTTTLFAATTVGGNAWNGEVMVWALFATLPTQTQLDAMSAAVTSYYGATVAV